MLREDIAKPVVAVDLFAGGGGLSVGLKDAGFLVCAAVEIDKEAAQTYRANHPETVLFEKDIRQITGLEIVSTSPTNKVDLISACPPCQGFSSLTAKYKRIDPRNELIFEFVRLVKEIEPLAIMMENVPGLAKRGSSLFEQALADFRALGYQFESKILEVADYGVPQRRTRLVLLGSKDGTIPIPPATHAQFKEKGKHRWRSVRDALSVYKLGKAVELTQTLKYPKGPQEFNWHVTRTLSALNLRRLKSLSAGEDRTSIPMSLRPDCHKESDSGFSNVYGRMSWGKPSPTITGGCTTLSKGRFGHPRSNRTISLREAALLQTFPIDYKIDTPLMESACRIVGNALPPLFAKTLAESCMAKIRQIYNTQK